MLTQTQILEIKNYLLSKKLQKDLLIEVEDHFVSQICKTMKEKNIGFQSSFLQIKTIWMGELRMVRANLLSLKMITVFEKKIVSKRLNVILVKSIAAAICFFALSILIPESSVFLKMFLLLSLMVILVVSLINKKLKFHQYLFLNFHPVTLIIMMAGIIIPFFITTIFPGILGSLDVSGYFSNTFLLSSILLVQIQLLYANFNDKKVLI